MKKPRVLHCITPYLFHTGSWVYSQITKISKLENIVLTHRIIDENQFPFSPIVSPQSLNLFAGGINKVYGRLFDDYTVFMKKTVSELHSDIVHAHFGYEAVRWLPLISELKIPLVTTFYGLDVSQLSKIGKWRRRYSRLFEYGTLFLAEGSFLKQQLLNLGCPEHKIIIQHLGIEPDVYPMKPSYAVNTASINLIQVSSFREKKGIRFSLHAVAILKKTYPSIRFTLIGSGETRDAETELKAITAELKITENVLFLGSLSHKETIQAMSKADVFIHPSVTAHNGDNEGGAPVSVIEASALGLPVIATFHADIPEVVINNKTGYLVRERDSAALAEKIADVIENEELRKSFGKSARTHVEKNYNLNSQIANLENIYIRCIN